MIFITCSWRSARLEQFQFKLGKKYWSTIIPYVKNGAVEKVVNYEYQFPLRLALFPGLSCMYYCGFCGRNQKAKYDGSIIEKGNQRFKDVISSMPKTVSASEFALAVM